ncbi:MAG: indoleacetamide hydrolase [Solirubrobacteraceae bacterium]|nr:indoleacetamide hydrolase [Solirubrobacteraceae bacterium]
MAIGEQEAAALTAVDAVAGLRSGDLELGEYVEALLRRTERLSSLGAYVTHDADAVLAAARAADTSRGPLYGLPVGIKDSIGTADMPTGAGTPGLDGWTPPVDAAVVSTLRSAGAVLTGKLALHELSSGVTSNNAHTGPVGNPYRPDHHTGGSSGGTAAAVTAGMVPVGLGGDTGGSCRIPAALCGCVGLRPTLGRYSQRGCVPISSTRDTPGPLGRTVADVRLLDFACTGYEPLARRELDGLRIGVPRDPFYLGLDPAVAALAEATLDLLATHGAVLIDVDLSAMPEVHAKAGLVIPVYESTREMAAYLLEHDAPFGPKDIIDNIAGEPEREIWTMRVDAADYREALVVHRPALQALYAIAFADHAIEALILPTTPVAAVRQRPAGQDTTVVVAGATLPLFPTYIRNTDYASSAGLPALSVPAGLTGDGLPVGMELVGPAGTDDIVLAIGEALEAARGPLPGPPL